MSTIISRPVSVPHEGRRSLRSRVNQFLNWVDDQQENRIGWEGIGLMVFGCVLTPLTVVTISLSGVDLSLILISLVAMAITLVTNLTAMPTKITIPLFLLGVVADFTIIVVSVFKAI
jgi:hypothetical protein